MLRARWPADEAAVRGIREEVFIGEQCVPTALEWDGRDPGCTLQNDLRVSRLTATKYLDQLTAGGFVEKHKIGRYNYYVNLPLIQEFTEIPDIPDDVKIPAAVTA